MISLKIPVTITYFYKFQQKVFHVQSIILIIIHTNVSIGDLYTKHLEESCPFRLTIRPLLQIQEL